MEADQFGLVKSDSRDRRRCCDHRQIPDARAGDSIRAGRDDLGIDGVDEIGGFRRRARGHLDDIGEAMSEIAGIDALGRVSGEEVAVEDDA